MAGGAAVAPTDAAAGKAAATATVVLPVADLLFVFDENMNMYGSGSLAPSTRRLMGFYQTHLWPGATFIGVSGWEELFALLGSYSAIRSLVLFTHGVTGRIGMAVTPGAASLGGVTEGTDYLPLTIFAEAFADRVAAEQRPTIEEIHFEGCFLGAAPNELAAMKRAFSARRVDGYNLFHGLEYWSLPATYPERRSAEAYAASKAARADVPAANSPFYVPGATDLSDTIGGTDFEETMWESFHDLKDESRLFARADMRTTTLTTLEAEGEYLFDKPGELHRVVVED